MPISVLRLRQLSGTRADPWAVEKKRTSSDHSLLKEDKWGLLLEHTKALGMLDRFLEKFLELILGLVLGQEKVVETRV